MYSPRIDIRDISLVRRKGQVLKSLSLTVSPAEIVCLLGPSGSGKSSLLRCINRLTEPPTGTIFFDNQDVTELDTPALRRRIGMVFQQVAIFPGTVTDNICFGPGLQNGLMSVDEVANLLAMADLPAEFADRDGQTLSGGEAQRVALARVLATKPVALLLDEPTSALDPAATKHVEETVLRLRESLGLTVLWVTHDPEQAKRVADRVCLLVNGRILDQGSPAHLLRPGSKHLTAVFAAGDLTGTEE